MAQEFQLVRADIRNWQELLGLARAFHLEDEHPLSAAGETALTESLEISPYVKTWLMKAGDATCGYAVVTYGYSIEFGGLTAYLDDFYVLPEFRGRGIGRRALDTFERMAKKEKCCIFHLEVQAGNSKARDFYLKRGFADTGRALLIKKLAE